LEKELGVGRGGKSGWRGRSEEKRNEETGRETMGEERLGEVR